MKVGFICYTQLKMPRIYGMSKHPSQSKAQVGLFTRCEHYSKSGTHDHYIQFLDDSYDLEYLEIIDEFEAIAAEVGYGPLS